MTTVDLTQEEADALIVMDKYKVNDDTYDYPGTSGSISIPLSSGDGRESFLLDVYRGRLDLRKGTYQERGRQIIVLVRLDFGGPPHRNPDGIEVGSPHLHIFREGFGDKWAFPLRAEDFPNITDPWSMLDDFMRYCKIVDRPDIRRGLFA